MAPTKKSTTGRKSRRGHSKRKSSATSTKPDPSTSQSKANAWHGYTTIPRDWPTRQQSWSDIEDQAQSFDAETFTPTDKVNGDDFPGELIPMERFAQETQREGIWNNLDAVRCGKGEETLGDYEIVGGSTDAAIW